MLPMAVAQSSDRVTKSQGEGAVLVVFFPIDIGAPIIFQRYRILAALLHGTLLVGGSQTLRR